MRLYFLLDDAEMGIDPLTSTQLTQGQRNRRFPSTDELPDDSLDPFEALAAKEEAMLTGLHSENGHQVEVNHTAVPVCLEKPEPVDLELYYNGVHEVHSPLLTTSDEPLVLEDKVEGVEHTLTCKRSPRRELWIVSYESHGRHGRKPEYKDKISQTVRF